MRMNMPAMLRSLLIMNCLRQHGVVASPLCLAKRVNPRIKNTQGAGEAVEHVHLPLGTPTGNVKSLE